MVGMERGLLATRNVECFLVCGPDCPDDSLVRLSVTAIPWSDEVGLHLLLLELEDVLTRSHLLFCIRKTL